MSSHPEETETETYSEIDEEPINVTESDSDEIEETEEGVDYDMSDDDDSDIPEIFEEPLQIDELLSSVLATPDGDTVCSALVNISHQLEVQNKILIKVLSAISKKQT
jgi:hypothetical protein